MNEQEQSFDKWAIVELMGHRKLAGRATEQVVAGQAFLRIDVPEVQHDRCACGHRESEHNEATACEVPYCNCLGQSIPGVISSFTQFYGVNSVYCLTPVSEETARRAASSYAQRPVQEYQLRLPAAPASSDGFTEEGIYFDPDDVKEH